MGQARDVVERWWSFFEAGRLHDAARLAHPEVDVIQPGAPRVHGQDELVAMLTNFSEAFSHIQHQIVATVEAGDKIAVELTVTMTHTGVFHTPQGDVPPTGATVLIQSVDVVTIAGDQIVSWHTYFDQMSFAAQLGLLPQPAIA